MTDHLAIFVRDTDTLVEFSYERVSEHTFRIREKWIVAGELNYYGTICDVERVNARAKYE